MPQLRQHQCPDLTLCLSRLRLKLEEDTRRKLESEREREQRESKTEREPKPERSERAARPVTPVRDRSPVRPAEPPKSEPRSAGEWGSEIAFADGRSSVVQLY